MKNPFKFGVLVDNEFFTDRNEELKEVQRTPEPRDDQGQVGRLRRFTFLFIIRAPQKKLRRSFGALGNYLYLCGLR